MGLLIAFTGLGRALRAEKRAERNPQREIKREIEKDPVPFEKSQLVLGLSYERKNLEKDFDTLAEIKHLVMVFNKTVSLLTYGRVESVTDEFKPRLKRLYGTASHYRWDPAELRKALSFIEHHIGFERGKIMGILKTWEHHPRIKEFRIYEELVSIHGLWENFERLVKTADNPYCLKTQEPFFRRIFGQPHFSIESGLVRCPKSFIDQYKDWVDYHRKKALAEFDDIIKEDRELYGDILEDVSSKNGRWKQ